MQSIHIKVFRIDPGTRVDVDRYFLVLPIQEERELVFGRREVNHEKSFQRDLQLPPGPGLIIYIDH